LNLEAFQRVLADKGMSEQAEDFCRASGTLAMRMYREEIERALRTPGFGGFQLLDVHDYPGQGTSLVGTLDVFWQSKEFVTPDAFRRYCSSTVLLASTTKFVWKTDETLMGTLDLANYSNKDLKDIVPRWMLLDAMGVTIVSGTLAPSTAVQGGVRRIGTFSIPLSGVRAPQKLTLQFTLEGVPLTNEWDFWIYPVATADESTSTVLVTEDFQAAQQEMHKGGKVLLLACHLLRNPEAIRFATPFWNTIMIPNQPKSMGIFCDPNHPALRVFPTSFHTDWQWWELVTGKQHAARLNWTEKPYRPIVQVIDPAPRNDKLGVVFEFKVGTGRLLVCSLDLTANLDQRPVARQLRHSLVSYANSELFAPQFEVSAEALEELFKV